MAEEGVSMREILFRGKRLDTGEWVKGYYLHLGPVGLERTYIIPHYASALYTYEVDPATVGQFIGRVDVYGARIFEGDIVEHASGRFVVQYINGISRFAGTKPGISFSVFVFENSVKVGNIHDNPELLEGGQA